MPPLTLSRLRRRIGDMGLPRVVWLVYTTADEDPEMRGFYDREKAEAYAAKHEGRFVGVEPLQILDPS